MNQEHEIVSMVAAARGDSLAADELVRKFLPFIRSEAVKAVRRGISDSDDDEDDHDEHHEDEDDHDDDDDHDDHHEDEDHHDDDDD